MGTFKGTIEIVNSERKQKFDEERDQVLSELFQTLSTLYQRKTGDQASFDLSCVTTMDKKASFIAECEKMELHMPELIQFMEGVAFAGIIGDLLGRKTEAIVHLYLI